MESSNQLNPESDSDVPPPSSGAGSTQPSTKSHKMNKPILLVVASLTVLGLTIAAITLLKAGPKSTTNTNAVSTARINITDQGFTPAGLSIKKGTTVTWTNTGNKPSRVAADPHPEHSSLQGLDSKDPIGPESSYSFKFDKPGTYHYHDHFNPTISGEITVE